MSRANKIVESIQINEAPKYDQKKTVKLVKILEKYAKKVKEKVVVGYNAWKKEKGHHIAVLERFQAQKHTGEKNIDWYIAIETSAYGDYMFDDEKFEMLEEIRKLGIDYEFGNSVEIYLYDN